MDMEERRQLLIAAMTPSGSVRRRQPWAYTTDLSWNPLAMPALSTTQTLALAVLLDDDAGAAAALADLLIEMGVDAAKNSFQAGAEKAVRYLYLRAEMAERSSRYIGSEDWQLIRKLAEEVEDLDASMRKIMKANDEWHDSRRRNAPEYE